MFFNSLLINGFSDFTSFKFLQLEVLSKMFWSEIIFLTNVNLLLRIEQRSILNTSLSHDLSFLSNQNDQFGVTVTHLHQYHNKYTLKIYLEYIGGGGLPQNDARHRALSRIQEKLSKVLSSSSS